MWLINHRDRISIFQTMKQDKDDSIAQSWARIESTWIPFNSIEARVTWSDNFNRVTMPCYTHCSRIYEHTRALEEDCFRASRMMAIFGISASRASRQELCRTPKRNRLVNSLRLSVRLAIRDSEPYLMSGAWDRIIERSKLVVIMTCW